MWCINVYKQTTHLHILFEEKKIGLFVSTDQGSRYLKPSQDKKGQKFSRGIKNGVFVYSWQLRKNHFW